MSNTSKVNKQKVGLFVAIIPSQVEKKNMKSFLVFLFFPFVGAFLANAPSKLKSSHHSILSAAPFDVEIVMPPTGSNVKANLKIEPVLDVPSEIVEVRYKVPFGLDVAPQNNLAVCTKDGSGGEKVGDVLRYTSQWTLGIPQGDGIVATASFFSGGVSWGCTMFNVMAAKSWDQVVEALVSNVESRTDEVVLLFERPTEA